MKHIFLNLDNMLIDATHWHEVQGHLNLQTLCSIIGLVEQRANFLPCFSLRSTIRRRDPVRKGRSENSEIEALVTVLLVKEPPPGAHTSCLPRSKLSLLRRHLFEERSPLQRDPGQPQACGQWCPTTVLGDLPIERLLSYFLSGLTWDSTGPLRQSWCQQNDALRLSKTYYTNAFLYNLIIMMFF